jgi:hypothetical protein
MRAMVTTRQSFLSQKGLPSLLFGSCLGRVSLVRHPKGAKSEYLGLTLQIDLLMISPPFDAPDFLIMSRTPKNIIFVVR